MDKIQEKFKKLRKTELNSMQDMQEFKTENQLSFDDYRICISVHVPFCFSSYQAEKEWIEKIIEELSQFVEENKNKILFGFQIKGGENLSKLNFKKLLDFCGKNIKFMQTSSDFEANIDFSLNSLDLDKIKFMAYNGFKRISFEIENQDFDFVKKTMDECKFYGIEKINVLVKDINIYDIHKLKPTQITLLEKSKKYKTWFKQLTQIGYYATFGCLNFSLNREDLGLSSFERNVCINNISYKTFGCNQDAKTTDGISINGENFILTIQKKLQLYLENSVKFLMFNLFAVEEILQENPLEKFAKEINFLKKKKYIKIENNYIKITKKGIDLNKTIIALFSL